MASLNKISNRTKIIASIAVFSALYAVLRIIQVFPIVGIPGARFSVSDALAPIYGIILGPYAGGISVIIGTFLGMALGKPVIFLGLDFLPAMVNAVAVGLLVRRKWIPAIVLNVALLAAFILHPYTSFLVTVPGTNILFPFVWLHIAALAVLISPLGYKAGAWVKTFKTKYLIVGLAILAFVGTMMQHLTGNILYEIVLGEPIGGLTAIDFKTLIWPSIFLLYPWERLVLVILAVLIGLPLIKALQNTFLTPQK